MRSALVMLVLGSCHAAGDLSITTTFTISSLTGQGPSDLDVLAGRDVGFHVELPDCGYDHTTSTFADKTCRTLRAEDTMAGRTALGDTASIVQPQILDELPDWAVSLTTCVASDSSYTSTLGVVAVIDPLNLRVDCAIVPSTVTAHDANGFPEIVTFTADGCTAEILDVVTNRGLEASGFTVDVDTGGAQVP